MKRWDDKFLGNNAASINDKKVIFKKKYFLKTAVNGLETTYGTGTVMCQKSELEPEP